MNKIFTSTVAMLMAINAYGSEQSFSVENNDTIIAAASKKEITRILFDNDIEGVEAIAGELQYNIKGRNLYLRTAEEKPVNFFVSTEGNNTYKFILDIRNIPANQIFVHEKVTKEEIHYRSSQISEELLGRIRKIISVALKPKVHVGFNIKKVSKSLGNTNDISLEKVIEVTGKRLRAEKIIMTNESEEPYQLDLKGFMDGEALAVYSESTMLEPKTQGILIKIYEDLP